MTSLPPTALSLLNGDFKQLAFLKRGRSCSKLVQRAGALRGLRCKRTSAAKAMPAACPPPPLLSLGLGNAPQKPVACLLIHRALLRPSSSQPRPTMAVRNALRTGLGLTAAGTARQVVLRGGGGGGGVPPPFARTLAPAGPLHEEHELIWDDGVAAETCLDFDAPHMSSAEGLGWFLGGFLFFYSVFSFASVTGPESQKLAVSQCLCGPCGGRSSRHTRFLAHRHPEPCPSRACTWSSAVTPIRRLPRMTRRRRRRKRRRRRTTSKQGRPIVPAHDSFCWGAPAPAVNSDDLSW